MKRKKSTRKTRNLALLVAVTLGCSVAPWGPALAAEQVETAEQFTISVNGDKEQAGAMLPYFQNKNHLATVAAERSISPGFVVMDKNSTDITIDKYTGDSGVYVYTHDTANPTTIYGGNLTIVSAGKDAAGQKAAVTLRTDSSGIAVTDSDVVLGVLNALAQKLTYKNYVKANGNERNLTGYAEIAEGLTQGSFTMRKGTISFVAATGQGKTGSFNSSNRFTTVLTGDQATDTEYKDYIQNDPANAEPLKKTIYSLRDSTIINPDVTSTAAGKNLAAIMPAAGKAFYIDTITCTLDLTGIKNNGGKVYGIYNDQAAGVRVSAPGGMSNSVLRTVPMWVASLPATPTEKEPALCRLIM
ncbi:hypothetical protein SRRS_11220 [Sporomusa rhizae]|uniref:hypothetical protein n=1 Tax=Sporomusa rhizae TaxID=357999 RepID=UPI00352A7D3F